MFPFVIKGKVKLGLRRDFHLSTVSLEERLTHRLISKTKAEKKRREITPTSGSWEVLTGGVSRLLSVGFLSTVSVRRIKVLTLKDHLAAAYVIDATATALLSVVVIPMILGTALIYNSKLSTVHAITLLLLLVITTWGLDVGMLVIMLRHEIRMIATEVRTVMMQLDTPIVEEFHHDFDAATLLATAYYYYDNSMTKRALAYHKYLIARHPESSEAELARERLSFLKRDPYYRGRPRTEEERAEERQKRRRRLWKIWEKRGAHGRNPTRSGIVPAEVADEKAQKKHRWFRLPGFLRIRFDKKRKSPLSGLRAGAKTPTNDKVGQKRGLLRFFRIGSKAERREKRMKKRWLHGPSATRRKTRWTGERKYRKRWWQPPWFKLGSERAEKRRAKRHSKKYQYHFTTYPVEENNKRRKLLRMESMKKRQARRRWERWTYGPGPPKESTRAAARKNRTVEGKEQKQRRWKLPGMEVPTEEKQGESWEESL